MTTEERLSVKAAEAKVKAAREARATWAALTAAREAAVRAIREAALMAEQAGVDAGAHAEAEKEDVAVEGTERATGALPALRKAEAARLEDVDDLEDEDDLEEEDDLDNDEEWDEEGGDDVADDAAGDLLTCVTAVVLGGEGAAKLKVQRDTKEEENTAWAVVASVRRAVAKAKAEAKENTGAAAKAREAAAKTVAAAENAAAKAAEWAAAAVTEAKATRAYAAHLVVGGIRVLIKRSWWKTAAKEAAKDAAFEAWEFETGNAWLEAHAAEMYAMVVAAKAAVWEDAAKASAREVLP